jgi:hypothetical protein
VDRTEADWIIDCTCPSIHHSIENRIAVSTPTSDNTGDGLLPSLNLLHALRTLSRNPLRRLLQRSHRSNPHHSQAENAAPDKFIDVGASHLL